MFEKITDNVEIHQTLPDAPNMTTQELKKEWDKGCRIIKEAFNDLIEELNNNMFPIGYRIFVNSDKDYSNHLGFTWQKVAKGKVLVGKDEDDEDFNTIGKTGGEKKHTLTTNEMPKQVWHSGDNTGGTNVNFNGGTEYGARTQGTNLGQAHNNLQPYEVVNIWERIL